MKAFLKNYRQAPRKVRLVADSIRGKRASDALTDLSFMPQRGARALHKLVSSAVANAKQADDSVQASSLQVKRVTVDKGMTYTRFRPRAFGRAAPIDRECSHIRVELAPADAPAAQKNKGKRPRAGART